MCRHMTGTVFGCTVRKQNTWQWNLQHRGSHLALQNSGIEVKRRVNPKARLSTDHKHFTAAVGTHKYLIVFWQLSSAHDKVHTSRPSSCSCCSRFHDLAVNDADVNGQEQDDENIVQETQEAKRCLRNDVKGRDEVDESSNDTDNDTHTEHENETTHSEELVPGVAQECGQISYVVHVLQKKNSCQIT